MSQDQSSIKVILTGGTIDSATKGRDRDVLNQESAVPGFLQNLNWPYEFSFVKACWKDSRDITDEDREKILLAAQNSSAQKIIITHGTFTLAETARYLEKYPASKNKTIVLTGSLTPLAGFENSDAPENLKFAVRQANQLPPGVYICIQNNVFLPQEAAKDEITGKFYKK